MATRVGDGVTIFSTASKSSYTTGTDGGSNYTVGSGANRVLLIAVHGETDTTGGTKLASSVTHNGQSATAYPDAAFLNRVWVQLWYIIAPTAGAGGTTVATNSLNRAMRVEVLETNDTDQTTPIASVNTSFGAGSTSTNTFSLTTTAADSLLVAMVSVQSGAGTFSASDGGTLTASGGGQTGTSGFSDVSGAVAYEAVPTAGAQTMTLSWVNANDAVGLMVEVLNAAGGSSGAGSSSGSATAAGTGAATAATAASSAGAGAASATGAADALASGAASGTGAANGTGSASAASVATSAGAATASAVGAATAASVASSSGVATVSGVTPSAGSIATASGVATGSAVGAGAVAAAATVAGAATVAATGQASASATGTSSAVATVSGVGRSSVSAVAVSGGSVIVLGIGAGTAAAVFSGAGAATVSGSSVQFAPRRAALAADSRSGVTILSAANGVTNIPAARGASIIQG